MQKQLWPVFAAVVSTAAAWAARRVATAIWSAAYGAEAPPNPQDRDVTWAAALGWAGLAGLSAGIARVAGRRGAAAAWKTVAKEHPPGIS